MESKLLSKLHRQLTLVVQCTFTHLELILDSRWVSRCEGKKILHQTKKGRRILLISLQW